ncbi:MAG TPA: DHA2 family efflux MFS transporter permease subunit [Methylomirabilota bacterium]
MPAQAVAATPVWRPAASPWLIAASVMLATFMEVLDTSVANVSLPHIAGSLAASNEEALWVLTSYLVSNAIVLPATGWFATVFGRKRFLTTCIVIFTLASVLAGAATSLGMIIVARVIQGAGGGALQPLAQAVLLESFPPERRGVAMAVYGMGVVVAPIVGPTLGGWITDNYSWRWIFYINVPVGLLAVLMTQTFVEDPPYLRGGRSRRIDVAGFALMAIGLGALQILLDKGQESDWLASAAMRWLAALALLGLAGFVVRELRAADPIVQLRIVRDRNFGVGLLLITVMGAVLYASLSLLPLFLQTLLGYPALQSGEAVSPRGLGALASMVIVGRLVGRVSGRWLVSTGFAVLAVATFMLGRLNLDVAMRNIVVPNVVAGLAMGFIFVPLTTMAMGTLRNEHIGGATGLYNLMRNIGGSFGIAAVTTLLARSSQRHQALLVGHLSPENPIFADRLSALTAALAPQFGAGAGEQATAMLYQELVRQATLLAYVDAFRLITLVCLLCIPLVFLFRSVRPRPGAAAAVL